MKAVPKIENQYGLAPAVGTHALALTTSCKVLPYEQEFFTDKLIQNIFTSYKSSINEVEHKENCQPRRDLQYICHFHISFTAQIICKVDLNCLTLLLNHIVKFSLKYLSFSSGYSLLSLL